MHIRVEHLSLLYCWGLFFLLVVQIQGSDIPVQAEQCTHVKEVNTSNEIDYDVSVLRPGNEHQRKVLGEALDLLPRFLCLSVRKVAFVELNDETKSAFVKRNNRQNLIHINVADGRICRRSFNSGRR